MTISIFEQVKCVRREISYRERVYPRLIAAGKMTQRLADEQIEAMRAVLATLEEVAAKQVPPLFAVNGG